MVRFGKIYVKPIKGCAVSKNHWTSLGIVHKAQVGYLNMQEKQPSGAKAKYACDVRTTFIVNSSIQVPIILLFT